MKRLVLLLLGTMSLTIVGIAQHQTRSKVVLPDSKLVGCRASDCSQLWQDIPTESEAIYPTDVNLDIKNGFIVGITAHYDKTVSVEAIKDVIDIRYGKSTYIDNETSPVKVWRVVRDRISIQLSVENNGRKQVIYLLFR